MIDGKTNKNDNENESLNENSTDVWQSLGWRDRAPTFLVSWHSSDRCAGAVLVNER